MVKVDNKSLLANLHVMDMHDFDVILGMDWLSSHFTTLNCREKWVTFNIPGEGYFIVLESGAYNPLPIISCLQVTRLLRSGCTGFVALVKDLNSNISRLEDISVVNKFLDVFLEDLPELPPDREIEFCVDLAPRTYPISKTPYRMSPVELKELQVQFQKLLDKGFIRPSVSSWGTPMLLSRRRMVL
uniref:Reverse transcriptase domain-containing protein n=1 Tax=Ananas comosus var. bracteatus TaxID=296719 RepID=A0A6V7P4N2_ANACO|nr:unnamed protein product [Ananas comosus var. bracteatus]